MKNLPLYLGIVLVMAAIAGGVSMVLHQGAPAEPEVPPVALAPVEEPEQEPQGPSPEELAKQDDEDSRRILYEQVSQTPADITPEWLESMCQFVRTPADLDAYWESVLERGRKYESVYEQANRNGNEVLSKLPQVYIFEAREYIHTQVHDADKLRRRVPNLLALAVLRAWQASMTEELSKQRGEKKDVAQMLLTAGQPVRSEENLAAAARKEARIPDDTKSSYLIEILRSLDLLAEIAEAEGEDPGQYMEERIRLHEVALVEGYYFIDRMTKEARERYSQSAASSAPATVAIGRWNSTLNERLLSLGKIYVDAALHEHTYRGRQQKYADLGFRALAMTFQRSKAGAAITVLREANKIQRYNLWQMGRAAWRQAQLAVKAGRRQEADDQFFVAKQRYLQTLSRLERSKQPAVLDEFRRLQAEIAAWSETKAAQAEG